MKFNLLIALLLITFLTSCKDDEDPVPCSREAWIGTYEGTSDCTGDITVEIEESTIDDRILVDGEFTDINGCSGSYDNIFLGNGQSLEITLSGDTITMIRTTAVLGVEVPCMTTAVK